jgi:hypothetical protein
MCDAAEAMEGLEDGGEPLACTQRWEVEVACVSPCNPSTSGAHGPPQTKDAEPYAREKEGKVST